MFLLCCQILDDEEERMIKLTAAEMRLVLAEQVVGLLRESPGLALPVDQVLLAFQRQYGFPLRLSDFGARDVRHLLDKIKHCTFVSSLSSFTGILQVKKKRANLLDGRGKAKADEH
jgi:hypothetical protein